MEKNGKRTAWSPRALPPSPTGDTLSADVARFRRGAERAAGRRQHELERELTTSAKCGRTQTRSAPAARANAFVRLHTDTVPQETAPPESDKRDGKALFLSYSRMCEHTHATCALAPAGLSGACTERLSGLNRATETFQFLFCAKRPRCTWVSFSYSSYVSLFFRERHCFPVTKMAVNLCGRVRCSQEVGVAPSVFRSIYSAFTAKSWLCGNSQLALSVTDPSRRVYPANACQ